jgi:hypothetical protein
LYSFFGLHAGSDEKIADEVVNLFAQDRKPPNEQAKPATGPVGLAIYGIDDIMLALIISEVMGN